MIIFSKGVVIMKSLKSSLFSISIALLATGTATTAMAQAQTATKADPLPKIIVTGPGTEAGVNYIPVPIETWAQRDAVSDVEVSPDGKHLLILKTEGSADAAQNVLEIYSTSDFSKPLRRLNAKPMELVSAQWVSDKHVYGSAWQKVRSSVKGPEDDVRSYRAFAYNLETNKFANADGTFSIVNLLPDEPDHVLVSEGRAVADATGVDPIEAFRPRAYYRYNLNTGERSLVLKGNDKNPSASFDDKGNPRFSSGRDGDFAVSYYRAPGDGSWKELSDRVDMSKPENVYRVFGGFHGFAGIDGEDPNKGYIIDQFGEDKAGLYEFDFKTGKVGKKVYSNPDADIQAVQRHSLRWNGNRKIVAAIYSGAKYERHWFDMEEKALYESLERKIQYAHQINITSRSRDGNMMIVYNSGPKDPGSYWFVKDGKVSKLASVSPGVKSADLNQVEFIKYPARDGRIIPAYVTYPKGKGPFPLVVIPHGGPAVSEVVGYDEWGQILANAGYMVLQPQYRISTGWGKEHFDAGYKQHGLAMQDDKDDGALYLVKEGLVDKNRMAMFGWSYGGYAALVATQRENNIYQCAIAGAAVADPEKQYLGRRDPYLPKALDDWSRHRGGTTVNPVKSIAKTNIPLLMIHGNFDRRVLYYHYSDYEAAAKKAGVKNIQFLTLKGADHFSNTLMYEHQNPLYTKMLDYLKKDCGPGGL
jgi:dipeptidyl aminopeptidase/acylaminoacyl peptidase